MIRLYPLQVEWMSEKLMRMFEDSRTNPFQFQHITVCHNLEELAKVSNPKVLEFVLVLWKPVS